MRLFRTGAMPGKAGLTGRVFSSPGLTFVERMNRSTTLKLAVLTGLALTGLLFVQFIGLDTPRPGPADKINLALRRTAHFLMAESGDSTSLIAPVEETAPGVWMVRLEGPVSYDRLPALLQESFDLHGIAGKYDVALVDCFDGILQLGYNRQDVESGGGIPCGGREQGRDCYNLQVTFPDRQRPGDRAMAGWWVFGGFLLAGLWIAAYRRSPRMAPVPDAGPPAAETSTIALGRSSLDMANLLLLGPGERRQPLTYREAKLLHLFASHANQLLERDFILKSVWEDEGIIVGRSVDVFVSRLRKLLRDDPSVRIATVHGVGYRLEVC
jgi:hypothetical protein